MIPEEMTDTEAINSLGRIRIIDHQHEPRSSHEDFGRIINAFLTLDVSSHSDMIHIEVPDTQTFVEKNDGTSKYTAYNIHINGWYHSSVRFNYLHIFADTIKQRFQHKYKGPDFPMKKLFKLDLKGIEERRQKIEKYLAAIVQHSDISKNYFVEKKFLEFQVESYRATSTFVAVDVHLGDGTKINIKCNVADNSGHIMKLVAEKLGMSCSDRFLWNFGLFMAKQRDPSLPAYSITSDSFDPLIVRLLRNFESPYISLQSSNQKSAAEGIYHFLAIRKLVWDPRTEEPLLDDVILSDLLYRQASQDYKNKKFQTNKPDVNTRLAALERKTDKLQFLRTCHLIPTYSYEFLGDCLSDYPKLGTKCALKLGRRQIVLTYQDEAGTTINSLFRATRIRVWRIAQTAQNFTFQFEYLMARETFEWIVLHTNQAVLMSQLLQSIGTEILYEHDSFSLSQSMMRQMRDPSPEEQVPEKKRDPRKPILVLKNAVDDVEDPLGVMESLRSFNELYNTISDALPARNEAFANITDDDL